MLFSVGRKHRCKVDLEPVREPARHSVALDQGIRQVRCWNALCMRPRLATGMFAAVFMEDGSNFIRSCSSPLKATGTQNWRCNGSWNQKPQIKCRVLGPSGLAVVKVLHASSAAFFFCWAASLQACTSDFTSVPGLTSTSRIRATALRRNPQRIVSV